MSALPRYRVMNWWEHGVRESDAEGHHCHVRLQEANVPAKEIGTQQIQRALEICARKPCVCQGDALTRAQL